MTIMPLSLLLAFSAAPGAPCTVVDSDAIFARDVAAIAPAFAQIPEDFSLGLLPQTGSPRVLRGLDLQRIARNRGFELNDLPDVCFQRRTFVPSDEQIAAAMQTSLNVPGAKIEVLSSSQRAVPTGGIEFPLEGLQYSELQKDLMWRGRAGEFPVWARVRISAAETRVVAVTPLTAGVPITKDQVRLETVEDCPLDRTAARNLDEVIGFTPKMSLRAMTAIRKTQLQRPPDVLMGDLVKVEVVAGGARLMLEGRAQGSAVAGSTIMVRNLSSGKDFRAKVTGKDRVLVQ